MHSIRHIIFAWISLVLLTLGSTMLGQTEQSGFWIIVLISTLIMIKGRIVVEFFLEAGTTRSTIRKILRFYTILWPLLIIITYLFGSQIATFTSSI